MVESSDNKLVEFLHILDPYLALSLRVDQQRESGRFRDNDAVLYRQLIRRQSA